MNEYIIYIYIYIYKTNKQLSITWYRLIFLFLSILVVFTSTVVRKLGNVKVIQGCHYY